MKPRRVSKKRRLILPGLILLAGVVCGSALGAFLALTHDLPRIQELENFRPSTVTRVFSADGKLLTEFFVEKRVPVSLDDIPDYLKHAVIATEDRRFYEHAGIDWRGIARALVKDILAGRLKEGGSTITQQLAKVLFLDPEKTLNRKLKEAILALQIERRYRKDEILTLYLNQIYLGGGAYGVEAAANRYFGRHVWELDLAECALIAGLPRGPTLYSPLLNPDKALARRATVVNSLRATGYITEEQYQHALKEPIRLATGADFGTKAPYFIAFVRPYLEEAVGENLLYRGGLTIQTTLRASWQEKAEKALHEGLVSLEKRQRIGEKGGEQPQGAVVVLDVRTGMIRAMVGGRDYEASQFNRARQAYRQPGSAFKPIIYAYALEKGYTQAQRIWDAPVSYPQAGRKKWEPQNYSGTYEGEITLRKALEISQNIVTIKLLERLGPSPVVDFARHLGIRSVLRPNLSLALGTSEMNLLELASVYQAFANGGIWVEPSGIVDVVDHSGKSLWKATPVSRLVLSQEVAYILTNMLQGVIRSGTGRAARRLPWALAGKTGTTENSRDALFVGYSPLVVTGVWVGNDSGRSLGNKETGARAALPIWLRVMEEVLPETANRNFQRPDSVTLVQMDARTGSLATPSCRDVATAAFIKGTEPTEFCPEGKESQLEKFY
ncbi:MAG: penicillin-binding protein 1A [Deltaproteobacteria bacterium]|nr:MAG: penicillin-binding protein 1A [Deltaproteobacteria bacterium]